MPPSPASSSKALARRAAAAQLRASEAAEHRQSNRATLSSASPTRRATAALSRVEPHWQPPWPGVVQLAAKPGAALPRQRALAHRQGPHAQRHSAARCIFTGRFPEILQLLFLSIGFGLGVWTYLDWQVLGIRFKCVTLMFSNTNKIKFIVTDC